MSADTLPPAKPENEPAAPSAGRVSFLGKRLMKALIFKPVDEDLERYRQPPATMRMLAAEDENGMLWVPWHPGPNWILEEVGRTFEDRQRQCEKPEPNPPEAKQ